MEKATLKFKSDTGDMKVTAEFDAQEQTFICRAYCRLEVDTFFVLMATKRMAEPGWNAQRAAEAMKTWCGY